MGRYEKLYFYIFVAHFFYSDLCNYKSVIHLQEIFQTSMRKLRNKCKHQQLCFNFQFQFCCADGLKSVLARAPSMYFG